MENVNSPKRLRTFVLEFSNGNTRERQTMNIQGLNLSHAKDILWYEFPDASNILDVTEQYTPDNNKPKAIYPLDEDITSAGTAN